MIEVAAAGVSLMPVARGFRARVEREIGGDTTAAGRTAGRGLGRSMASSAAGALKAGLGVGIGVALTGLAKASLSARAEFEGTLNEMAAVADVPAAKIQGLSDLAMQMGRDTVFSAQDAAAAMLELAKGGLSAATIQAGALQGTLTLAAAGGLEMASAAEIGANALNTFGLAGKDMGAVAAALAGGANASSASVESLGVALGQVGPGAKLAGLSLQETVAVLAAFDNAGIKGSDAGTSLKTMLTRLVPQTKASADAMRRLGLDFTDAQGNFVPIANVAEQLKKRLGGLSESQRTAALNTIFGADAARAAAVLMGQGAAGVAKYTNATSDLGAAQRVAEARMKGLPGALERLRGSYDTAKLAIGGVLSPAAAAGADALSGVLNKVSAGAQQLGPKLGPAKAAIAGLFTGAGKQGSPIASFVGDIKGAGAQVLPALQSLGGPVKAFVGPLLTQLGGIGKQLLGVAGPGIRSIAGIFSTQLVPAVRAILPVLRPVASFLIGVIGGALVGVLKGAVRVISGVFRMISGILNIFAGLFTGDWSRLWLGVKQLFGGALQAILGIAQIIWNGGILKVFRLGIAAVKGIFTGGFRALVGIGRSAMSGVVGGIKGGVGNLVAIVRTFGPKIIGAVKGAPKWLLSTGKNVVEGLVSGIKASASRVLTTITATITDKIPQWVKDRLGIRSPSRVMAAIARWIPAGIAVGITRGGPEVRRAVLAMAARVTPAALTTSFQRLWTWLRQAGIKTTSALGKAIAGDQRTLLALTGKRDALTTRITAQQSSLNDLVKARADLAAQVRGSVVTADWLQADGGADGMIAALQKRLDQTDQLRDTIRQLQTAGLDRTTLTQLTERGIDALPAAQALLASGRVREVAALQTQLGAAAGALGTTTASAMYDAGIASAKGIIAGLTSQRSAIATAMVGVANHMVATLKKSLKIKSPSQRLRREIGAPSMLGVGQGMLDEADAPRRALDQALAGLGGDITATTRWASAVEVTGDPLARIADLVTGIATRPIVLTLDGREVARVSSDHLAQEMDYGRVVA